jgi:hypothetical protein
MVDDHPVTRVVVRMTHTLRYVAIGLVQASLLLGAFGLGRAMATPTPAAQATPIVTFAAPPRPTLAAHACPVTGDLVGDANPADVARALC